MKREEFYKLTDILNSDVLGNFMHDGEADELIAMFEEAVEHSNILKQEEPVSNPIDFEKELYKAFGQVKDFTLGMRIAKRFYDMGKNSQESESEDLGEYINELSKQFPEVSFAKLSRIAVRVAKWQKEKMITKAADATIGLPYENKDGGYTHLIDVSRPLPVGNNKIAIIFEED